MTNFQFEQRRFDRIAKEAQAVGESVMSRQDTDCREEVNKLAALVCELTAVVQQLHKAHRQTQHLVQE